jgi:Na+/H+-dicarboxylate symporter
MKANPIRWKLHWQILLALGLSLAAMLVIRQGGLVESGPAQALLGACNFVGDLFMRLLRMIVVPLIVSAIVSGMIGLGTERNFGRLGAKVLAYYLFSGLIAVCIGLAVVNTIRPGEVDPETAERMIGQQADVSSIRETAEEKGLGDFFEVLLRMVPTNVFSAASDNGQLLSVIFFAVLYGFFVTRLSGRAREVQASFWESAYNVMVRMADLIIRFAPIGVFALVTPRLVDTGWSLFVPVGAFALTVLLALGLHLFGTMSVLLALIGRVNPIHHLRGMASALLTAFSTASSVSTLPVTLECVQKNAKVSNRVSSFTLPLGATVNMDGTALYECVVVIFIAQFQGVLGGGAAFGVDAQFTVVLLALLTSIGVAGIPQASLTAIVVILLAVGLDPEYIGIVLVVDRILDMCRTAVNIFSDSVGAVIIARSEGERPYGDGPARAGEADERAAAASS